MKRRNDLKVGVIVLNYNSSAMTAKLVNTLKEYKLVNKIIVVDNNSTDSSRMDFKNLTSPKIELLFLKENKGYSNGNNYGLKKLYDEEFDVAIVANPDIYISEEDFATLINSLCNSEYSVLSPIEYDFRWQVVNPQYSKRMDYTDDLLDCFYFGRKINKKLGKQIDKNKQIQDVGMLKGSFLAFDLKTFQKVGFFDENVFLYCEERILSKKMEDNNYKMGLITNAKYQHNHKASIVNTYKSSASRIKILYKSRYYYNVRYLHIGLLKRILLKLMMSVSICEYKLRDFFAWCMHIKKWRINGGI